MVVANTSDFHWKPKESLPPGAYAANVFGNPPDGNYAFFGKFPEGFTVPTHWHTNDVSVAIMSGSMVIRRENKPDVEIKQGGFFFLPAKMRYAAHCPHECIFLAYGTKPFDIFYGDPKDDPRSK